MAGPIERISTLLKQINGIPNMRLLDYERISNGLIYMLYGHFLKMVIADRVSLMVDTVFDSWYLYGTVSQHMVQGLSVHSVAISVLR